MDIAHISTTISGDTKIREVINKAFRGIATVKDSNVESTHVSINLESRLLVEVNLALTPKSKTAIQIKWSVEQIDTDELTGILTAVNALEVEQQVFLDWFNSTQPNRSNRK